MARNRYHRPGPDGSKRSVVPLDGAAKSQSDRPARVIGHFGETAGWLTTHRHRLRASIGRLQKALTRPARSRRAAS